MKSKIIYKFSIDFLITFINNSIDFPSGKINLSRFACSL